MKTTTSGTRAEPALKRWHPRSAAGTRPPSVTATPGSDAILVDEDTLETEPCDLHTLARAAGAVGLLDRFFRCDERYKGEAWYDGLARLTECELRWQHRGQALRRRPNAGRAKEERLPGSRPESLLIALRIRDPRTEGSDELTLPADVAVANPGDTWPGDAILLGATGRLEPDELASFLADACHVPQDPSAETDSVQHQRDDFTEQHFAMACRLLLPETEAARRTVEHVARGRLSVYTDAIPAGTEVTVRLRRGEAPQVAIEPGR